MSGPDTEGSFGWNGIGLTRGAAARKKQKKNKTKKKQAQTETKSVTNNNVTSIELSLLVYYFIWTSTAYTECNNYIFNYLNVIIN